MSAQATDSLPGTADSSPPPDEPLSEVAEGAVPFERSLPVEFVPGDVLIRFMNDLPPTASEVATVMRGKGLKLKRSHSEINVHYYTSKVKMSKNATLALVKALDNHPFVEFAEPNGIIHGGGGATPLDPWFDQLNLGPPGFTNPDYYGFMKIKALTAWDYATGDPDKYLAIIDTGVNWQHPEFSGRVWVPTNQLGNCVTPNTWPMDDNGHGSAVAGIALASGNNGKGGAGVAYTQRILAVKILDSDNSGTWEQLVCGINLAAAINETNVINLSVWGYGASTAIYDAMYNAWVTRGKTVISITGNGDDIGVRYFPGCYSRNGLAITVGATNYNDERWHDEPGGNNNGSTSNDCITVAAPGDTIWSPWTKNNDSSDTYSWWKGTSFAAPFVAGTAALMHQYAARPNTSIRYYLTTRAKDLGVVGYDTTFGSGLIDAYRSVTAN